MADEEVEVQNKKPKMPVSPGRPKAKVKMPRLVFRPPEDWKPTYYEIMFETLRDGLIRGSTFSAWIVKGHWDNPDNPRFSLEEFDPGTLLAIASRISAATYSTSFEKRLPQKAKFGMVIRVALQKENAGLLVTIKGIRQLKLVRDKPKWVWFDDKSDIVYRRLRRCRNILPSAFIEAKPPPRKRKLRIDEIEGN
jgi:hypothetical protein